MSFPKNPSVRICDAMLAILHLLGTVITNLFKSRRRLEAENLFLRHQLNIALRRAPHRPRLRGSDRAVMVWLTWLWPSLTRVARVVEPDTILRWHRAGFRAYWRWKSRGQPGRPKIERELRDLIQQMSKENPLWGAPRQIPFRTILIGRHLVRTQVTLERLEHLAVFQTDNVFGGDGALNTNRRLKRLRRATVRKLR